MKVRLIMRKGNGDIDRTEKERIYPIPKTSNRTTESSSEEASDGAMLD